MILLKTTRILVVIMFILIFLTACMYSYVIYKDRLRAEAQNQGQVPFSLGGGQVPDPKIYRNTFASSTNVQTNDPVAKEITATITDQNTYSDVFFRAVVLEDLGNSKYKIQTSSKLPGGETIFTINSPSMRLEVKGDTNEWYNIHASYNSKTREYELISAKRFKLDPDY